MSATTGTGLSRRLAVLFLLSLLGVLVVLGIVVAELGGVPALLVCAAAAGLLVGLGVVKGRRAAAAARRPAVQHCSCCDGDHTAPVQVL